ncbi:SdpI family protein [Streptomyces daliensis]|uniref:SdpI family protein n=1 Tax=Streptomyces daliensis TaxID=299421 RepID=A0A8T4IUT2_9ACTN|nr:SdpI family protein [Streptomyces daliensis]
MALISYVGGAYFGGTYAGSAHVGAAVAESPDGFSRVVLALVLGASGVLVGVSGWLGAGERLRRNPVVGIRTRRSLASDEAWRTVHRFAAPWFYASGAALVLGGVGAAVVGNGGAFLTLALATTTVSVALALLAIWRGHRALDRSHHP